MSPGGPPSVLDRFTACLPVTLRFEGGFVDDPVDRGGRTQKGVTQKAYDAWLARQGRPSSDVKDISDNDLAALYRDDYWAVCGAANLVPPLDLLHFDAAVNHGPGRAASFLHLAEGDPKKYLDAREQFYRAIVAKRPEQEKFLKGWLNRVRELRAVAGVV